MKCQKLLSCVAFATVLLAVSGCGRLVGDITGTVKLNGEVLDVGRVTALNDKGEILGVSNIGEGGVYKLTDITPGPVILIVQTYDPSGKPLGLAGAAGVVPIKAPPSHKPVPGDDLKNRPDIGKKLTDPQHPKEVEAAIEKLKPVPLKYTNVSESDLKTTVVKGQLITFEIEMTGEGKIPELGDQAKPAPGQDPRKRPGRPDHVPGQH